MSIKRFDASPTEPLELWRQLARKFLSPDDEILDAEPASGGFSGAEVARVTAASGVYALRAWPHESPPWARIGELHRFLAFLRQESHPVAVPFPQFGGSETCVSFYDRIWQLEPWLPGEPVHLADLDDEGMADVMRSIARLHLSAARYDTTSAGRTWFARESGASPAIANRREFLARWTPAVIAEHRQSLQFAPEDFRRIAFEILSRFSGLASRIDADLARWERVSLPLHPCWRDLWSAHVLIEDRKVAGFIDAGAVCTDHVAADLSRFLASCYADQFDKWTAALDAYTSVRPLTQEERALVRTLDRSSVALSGMTWIARWQDGQVSARALPDTVERLASVADRLDALASAGIGEGDLV